MGYDLGSVACMISTIKWPKKGFGKPSCDVQVWLVGKRALALGNLDFVSFFGKRTWYLLKGIMLT